MYPNSLFTQINNYNLLKLMMRNYITTEIFVFYTIMVQIDPKTQEKEFLYLYNIKRRNIITPLL